MIRLSPIAISSANAELSSLEALRKDALDQAQRDYESECEELKQYDRLLARFPSSESFSIQRKEYQAKIFKARVESCIKFLEAAVFEQYPPMNHIADKKGVNFKFLSNEKDLIPINQMAEILEFQEFITALFAKQGFDNSHWECKFKIYSIKYNSTLYISAQVIYWQDPKSRDKNESFDFSHPFMIWAAPDADKEIAELDASNKDSYDAELYLKRLESNAKTHLQRKRLKSEWVHNIVVATLAIIGIVTLILLL